MNIIYKDTKEFKEDDLINLFLSVDWESGKYPEKLKQSMIGYDSVFSAWIDNELVGLACVMDDGIMTAYMHYLLVNPKYQNQKIGKQLVDMVKQKYKDFLKIVIVSYNSSKPFYEKCGFEIAENSISMYFTKMNN